MNVNIWIQNSCVSLPVCMHLVLLLLSSTNSAAKLNQIRDHMHKCINICLPVPETDLLAHITNRYRSLLFANVNSQEGQI